MITHSKNKTKRIKQISGKAVDFFLDLIFPKFCFACKKEGSYLCADCKNRLRDCHSDPPTGGQQADKESQRSFSASWRIRMTHASFQSVQDDKSSIYHHPFCPVCKNKIIFPQKCSRGCNSQIKLALSPFSYDNFLIKDLIHNFKYNFIKSLGIDLAEFTVESIKHSNLLSYQTNELSNFLVVPVPLHRRRLAWRGFNQSEILAKEIAEALDIKFSNALKRIKNTKPQIEMTSADERLKNISGAFMLRQNSKWLSLLSFNNRSPFCHCERIRQLAEKRGNLVSRHMDCFVSRNDIKQEHYRNLKFKNKTIILVDDMLTTGATLEECAKILKQNGAREIWALTVAK